MAEAFRFSEPEHLRGDGGARARSGLSLNLRLNRGLRCAHHLGGHAVGFLFITVARRTYFQLRLQIGEPSSSVVSMPHNSEYWRRVSDRDAIGWRRFRAVWLRT